MANPLMGKNVPTQNIGGGNNPMNILMQMMSGGINPQQLIQTILQRNPQANTILNQMKSSGMTPEQFVRQYAKQNGIDINPMVNYLNQKGKK